MNRLHAAHPLHLLVGHALWLVWFGLVYGGVSVACAAAAPAAERGPFTAINLALLLVTALVAAALGWAGWQCRQARQRLPANAEGGRDRFMAKAASWLYAGSAIATALVGLPLLVLPPCV